MSHWFDARAAKSGGLSKEQRDKIHLIKEALGKSDVLVHRYFHEINLDENSAVKFGYNPSFYGGGLFSAVSVETRGKLGDELLRARDRLYALHTGLRAERELRQALTAAAAGAHAWRRGLSTDDPAAVDDAQAAVTRHFTDAQRLAKSGLADLEKGR